ncbi:MAG: type I-E CRISPR-associated protein Cse1/CasA, partial [Desulfarculaceae bacterium]
MTLNLISDPWIPVLRRSGARKTIAPWQITQDLETDPIQSLDAPRPDFSGALVQFLIGLLQTAFAPGSIKEWRNHFLKPPSPQTLRKAFQRHEPHFNLLGSGPRFMQDLHLILTKDNRVGLAKLLLETPGSNTERNNADLFIKRGQASRQCPACLAMALYTLQTNANQGGSGNRTSLRGGGPLTTIILAGTLWSTVWINVLTKKDFETLPGGHHKKEPQDILPWLAPCRTSENKTGAPTMPEDVNPLQMYWGMPRRIRVDAENPEQGTCHICGQESRELLSTCLTKNYGINYEGAWQHP